MINIRRIVTPLRILLALFFAALLLAQTLMNYGQFMNVGPQDHTPIPLRILQMAFVATGILCVQIVVICVWKLLTLVQRETIFSPDAFRWVDLILRAIAAGCMLLVALFGVLFFTFDDPGFPMALFIVLLAGSVIWMLVAVLRTLLVQATELRTELDGVV